MKKLIIILCIIAVIFLISFAIAIEKGIISVSSATLSKVQEKCGSTQLKIISDDIYENYRIVKFEIGTCKDNVKVSKECDENCIKDEIAAQFNSWKPKIISTKGALEKAEYSLN